MPVVTSRIPICDGGGGRRRPPPKDADGSCDEQALSQERCQPHAGVTPVLIMPHGGGNFRELSTWAVRGLPEVSYLRGCRWSAVVSSVRRCSLMSADSH